MTISSAQLGQEAVFKDLNLSNSSGLVLSDIDFSSAGSTSSTDITQFNINGCSNITLDGLTVHGDPNGTLATDASGLLIRGSANVTVSNSTFYHLHSGITQLDNQHLNITGNTMTHIWDDGVRGVGSSYVNIRDNTFSSFHMDASDTDHPDCIQFWTTSQVAAHDINISGNTYTRGDGNAVQGAFIENDSNVPYTNVVVENNNFVGALYNGILLGSATNSIIANNTLSGFDDTGSWVRVLGSSGVLLSDNRAGQYVLTEGNTALELIRDGVLASEAVTTVASVAPINLLYDTYVGRDPTQAELGDAESRLAGGEQLSTLRSDLLATSEAASHTQTTIVSLYDTLVGHDPDSSSLSQWQGQIAGGSDLDALRASLMGSSEGQAHVTSSLTSLYETFDGRDPTSTELGVWQAFLAADGGQNYSMADIQQAVASSAEGQAHMPIQIKAVYDTYMNRDPGSPEVAYWADALSSGSTTFTSFRATVLNDPASQAHTSATITSLYDTYFGRDPQSSEVGFWQGAIAAGDDFYQLQDTLERQSTSSSVQHMVAGASPQGFSLGSGVNYATLDNFNPSQDTLTLSQSQYGGINPLDAAHAHQIAALGGTTDVLITLDATHSVLFEHTQLAQLHSSDFLFG